MTLCFYCSISYAQYEDFLDAPTRTPEEAVTCTIEGVQFEKKIGASPDQKDLTLLFLLTERPSAYFNYYDAVKKAVIFDFYDTRIGTSIMEPIHEHPISNSTIEQMTVDLNKDVAGLRPDLRDMVRVNLFTPYDFDYSVQEDFGVISVNFKWSRKIENGYLRKKRAFYWQFPLVLSLLGGAGYATYIYLIPDVKTSEDIVPGRPFPIDHPN